MPRPRKKTVGDALAAVSELKNRSAVQNAMISILRSRYLPRDGMPEAQAHISCEGAPVPTALIEEIVMELEEGVEEMGKQVTTFLAERIEA